MATGRTHTQICPHARNAEKSQDETYPQNNLQQYQLYNEVASHQPPHKVQYEQKKFPSLAPAEARLNKNQGDAGKTIKIKQLNDNILAERPVEGNPIELAKKQS